MRSLSLSFSQRHAGRAVPFKVREKEREKDRRKRERERQQRWKKSDAAPGSERDRSSLALFFVLLRCLHLSQFFLRRSSFPPLPDSSLVPLSGTMLRTFVSEVASRGLRVQAVPALSRGFATSKSFIRSSSVSFFIAFSRRPTSFFSDRTRALRGQSKPFYRPFRVFRRV